MTKKTTEEPKLIEPDTDLQERVNKFVEKVNELQNEHEVGLSFEMVYDKPGITGKIIIVDTRSKKDAD